MVPHFAYNKTTGRNADRPADRLSAFILDCILLLTCFWFGIVFAVISYAAPESVYKIYDVFIHFLPFIILIVYIFLIIKDIHFKTIHWILASLYMILNILYNLFEIPQNAPLNRIPVIILCI